MLPDKQGNEHRKGRGSEMSPFFCAVTKKIETMLDIG